MTDGIYETDVHTHFYLMSPEARRERSQQDWFFWWLTDNDIDYTEVQAVVYNELQQTIYVSTYDWDNTVVRVEDNPKSKMRLRKRGPIFTWKDYPVLVEPPEILLERWDWLMEEFYGSERALCATT